MKKVLFIDRDGTLVIEPPVDYQLDSLEKLEFYPKVMRNLGFVRSKLDFEFVMVTNQDGLGTASFPEETFWPAHNLMMKTLEGEGVTFDDICIDRSMPEDNAPSRYRVYIVEGHIAEFEGNVIVATLQTIGRQITILQVDFEVVLDIRLDIYVAELIGQVKVNR